MKKLKTQIKNVEEQVVETVDNLRQVVDETEKTIDHTVAPVRDGVIKRFPTLFILLVTFGVSLVLHALDEFINMYSIFVDKPLVALIIGVVILALTGRLYKKLG